MKLQLSATSNKILRLFFDNGNIPLYVNEIVRKTNLYPNSVQRALKTLEQQSMVSSKAKGNRRFFTLNENQKQLALLKSMFNTSAMYTRPAQKYIKWVNRECSVALNAAIGSAQCNPKYIKRFRIEPVTFLWYNSVTGGVYNSFEQVVKTGERISKEVKRDASFAKNLANSCIRDGEKLITETRKSAKKDLTQLSDRQLYRNLSSLHELFLRFMPYYVIPHAIEKAIESELAERVFKQEIKEKLTEPVCVLSEEQADELKLAALVKENGWSEESERALQELTDRYCWLPMMALHHKPFDINHFRKIINELVTSIKDPKKELSKLQGKEKDRVRELEDTLNDIKADKELINLVSTTQAYLNLRTYRVNITKMFHYYHLPLLAEMAKRLNISNEDIAFLTYYEILDALRDTRVISKLKHLIEERKGGFVNLTWKGKTKVIAGVKNIIQAMEQYNILAETPTAKKEIRGNPACKGMVTGCVKIVKRLSDLEKVQEGDVLVARMTTPDYMLAIHKAVAIVTDEGGITCHAAIVSREFNIPCIVATRNSTQVLSDGDIVEVDANEGIVRVVESADFPEDVKELQGKIIYKGKVTGTARVILDTSDFEKLQEGDIVIAPQTTPEYLSLLYRAKGFVVDEESLTSHAVLYGRALELPSIMGTGCARFIIKDGERVELDAMNGVIKRLSLLRPV